MSNSTNRNRRMHENALAALETALLHSYDPNNQIVIDPEPAPTVPHTDYIAAQWFR